MDRVGTMTSLHRAWHRVAGFAAVALVAGVMAGTAAGALPTPPPLPATPLSQSAAATSAPASGDGSAAVGSTAYPMPRGSYFVSPSGSDGNPGTQAAPFLTLGKAVSAAPSGSTIVMRAGVYHESVKVPANKTLTIQSYPNEAVWLDGSVPVTNWMFTLPGVWSSSNWTAQFASVDYDPNASQYYSPVTQAHPMAGHPDQVFYDGTQLTQVGSLNEVKSGDFYVDYSTDQLYIGSNPMFHTVRGTTLSGALYIASPNTVVRGIGVRDYATPYGWSGTVQLAGNNDTLRNVEIDDSATKAIGVTAQHDTISNVTVERAGQLGVGGNEADYLNVAHSLFDLDNQQQFNVAPVAGGVKCTSCRYALVNHSTFTNGYADPVWFDTSSYADRVLSNLLINNVGPGIHFEVSGYETAADNVIIDETASGLVVVDSNNVRLWNNTVVDSGNYDIDFLDGPRVASDPNATQWRDPRTPNDPNITWVTNHCQAHNNVAVGSTAAAFNVEDLTQTKTGSQMVSTSNNAFYRNDSNSPTNLFRWANYGGQPALETFPTLAAMQQSTGQETGSMEQVGGTDPYYQANTPSGGQTSYGPAAGSPSIGAGLPLPNDIAQALGVPSGQPVDIGTLTR